MNYSEQTIVDRIFKAFYSLGILLVRLIVYFPHTVAGYLVSASILGQPFSALELTALTVVFAFGSFSLLYLIKGIMIGLIIKKNLMWIPLFILCLLYTCTFPAWIIYEPLNNLFMSINKQHTDLLTWLFLLLFVIFIYTRYQFMTDIAPRIVLPFYRLGLHIAMLFP